MASLSSLLSTLTESLTSATLSLPDTTTLAPPTEGISLLDLKTELLLSYLHNLTFLILLKLRNQTPNTTSNTPDENSPDALTNAVTHKLIELRIYLEKGVRPLESRLKYQLDKLLLAASEDAATTNTSFPNSTEKPPPSTTTLPPLSHRPNPSAFARPSQPTTNPNNPTGPYRPPRIHPTTLPPSTSRPPKPRPSHTLETFITEEMSSLPTAEPSIGAGSFLKGKAREREEERRAYEEMRLVRLPGEKKEGKKKRRRDGVGEDVLGGLGGLGDVEFGDGGGKKRKGEGGRGERVGERWERRVEREVGRKRR